MVKHDGCLGCKYEHKEEYEFPCSHCRGTIPPNNPMKEKIAERIEGGYAEGETVTEEDLYTCEGDEADGTSV